MGNKSDKGQSSVEEDDFVTVKSYKGETKHGKRHGRGVYLYPNGDMYDGGWRKSKKYGKGVYVYADGKRKEGYFYHDEYIGKEPNEKIKRRMTKKKNADQVDNKHEETKQNDGVSNGKLDETDETTESEVKLKTEGGRERRIQSLRRNKWLRDKYDIDVNTEALDLAKPKNRKNKNIEEQDGAGNSKRSFSFGSKKQKNEDLKSFDEATERRNSKRLRESIRKKYNLPTPDNSRIVDSTRRK
ncbi:radial spoke head 10 homolog B-like [Dendronephthya gigantea]|uniref:radial spoke head 10 homolog B-like n=1 Tax=Dendronephthya gigantea TaxID=151771 RepID=UPI00106C3082|nr:radial spoke head 10 homolog B-like [Dendronephthya gigantea]